MIDFKKKNILDSIILLPILWVFTGLFLYPEGKKLIVILTILSATASIYSYGLEAMIKNIKNNKLIWLLSICSIFALFAKSYYGYSSSLTRALIALLVLFTTFPVVLAAKINLKYLVIIGTLTSLVYVMFETYILGHGRMWSINPIPYATFIASLSITSFYYLLQSRSLKAILLWSTTFIASVIPLLYSQSRGLWLALFVMIIVVVVKSCLKSKKSIFLLIPFLIISAAAYHFSEDKITQRISQTKKEIQNIEKGNLNTSIGLRLKMWEAGLLLAQESPLIGLGNTHIDRKKELVKQKLISSEIVRFTHYHNQFLSDFVKYGIIGFSLLLMTVFLPAYYLIKKKDQFTWPGILVVAIFLIASLTDVPFQHAQTITVYFVFMYFFTLQKNSDSTQKQTRSTL